MSSTYASSKRTLRFSDCLASNAEWNDGPRLPRKDLLSMREEEGFVTSDTTVSTTPSVAGTGSRMAAFKPPEPTMGGLTQIETDKWLAWTGGKPKVDWSGLADEHLADYKSPNQMRPVYDVKGYNHRKSGLTSKFNKCDMLIPFKRRVWTHLKDHGLDSISYLPDMRNEMSCVIYDHSRYTLESAKAASVEQAALYDKYDVTNNIAAVAFLLDSLSPALFETISEKLEESDSFHVVWLELMNEIPAKQHNPVAKRNSYH